MIIKNKYKQTIIQKYIINEIHPILEIQRKKIYLDLINKIKTLIKIDNKNNITFDKFIIRFFFQQYVLDSYIEEKIDPFFPSSLNCTDQLEIDLSLFINDKNIIKNTISYMIKNDPFIFANNEMLNYYKNESTKKMIKNYGINKELLDNNNEKIILIFNGHKISIKKSLYNKLNTKIHNININRDILIWCLLYRYNIFSNKTQSLSVDSKIYTSIKKIFGEPIELFSSSINSQFNKFCSLYYDIEKYFGSLGSFFNLIPLSGYYVYNPPFDEYIMDISIKHLIESIDEDNIKKITIFGFIPIWDEDGKKIIDNICGEKINKNNINYGEYKILTRLKNSKYLKLLRLVCKNHMPYYEHFEGKRIYASNTYVFILSNHLTEMELDKIFRFKIHLITHKS